MAHPRAVEDLLQSVVAEWAAPPSVRAETPHRLAALFQEGIRDGLSVAELLSLGASALGRLDPIPMEPVLAALWRLYEQAAFADPAQWSRWLAASREVEALLWHAQRMGLSFLRLLELLQPELSAFGEIPTPGDLETPLQASSGTMPDALAELRRMAAGVASLALGDPVRALSLLGLPGSSWRRS